MSRRRGDGSRRALRSEEGRDPMGSGGRSERDRFFSSKWKRILPVVLNLLEVREPAKGEFIATVDLIYELCMSAKTVYKEMLYESLKECLAAHCVRVFDSRVRLVCIRGTTTEFLERYVGEFDIFFLGLSALCKLFSCLSKMYIMEMNLVSGPYTQGRYREDHILFIGHVGTISWRHYVYQRCKHRIVMSVVSLIEQERNGASVDRLLIRSAVRTFSRLGIGEGEDSVSQEVYVSDFEGVFLEDTKLFFRERASSMISEKGVSTFLVKAQNWIIEEEERAERYLVRSVTGRKMQELYTNVIIQEQLDVILDGLPAMLESVDTSINLNRLYMLLLRLPSPANALSALSSVLRSFVERKGVELMEGIGEMGEASAISFVETVVPFMKRYSIMIREDCLNDVRLRGGVQMAIMEVINSREEVAEWVARYLDYILRKNSKMACALADEDFDTLLDDVIGVLSFVSQKDVFQKLFNKMLAYRLVHRQWYSLENEKKVSLYLRPLLGYVYTTRLNRMITDVVISGELSDSFRGSGGPRSFSALVLTQGSWNFERSSFDAPSELSGTLSRFERYYHTLHSYRRLVFVPHLFSGTVKLCFADRPYELFVHGSQLAVLCAMSGEAQTVGQIRAESGVGTAVLMRVLKSLFDQSVILFDGESMNTVSDSTKVTVNEKFRSRRRRIVLRQPHLDMLDARLTKAISDDRKLLLQTVIIRIMKSRGRLNHTQLIQEVLQQVSSRFEPSVSVIKVCITALIDQQYLRRVEGEMGMYEYIS